MSNRENDGENYLAGESELSKLYQHTTKTIDDSVPESPGLELDNTILAAARREVGSRPRKKLKRYSPFSNNYLIPLSTAASMLIVVAVVSYFPEQYSFTTEKKSYSSQVDAIKTEFDTKAKLPDQEKIVELKRKLRTKEVLSERVESLDRLSNEVSEKQAPVFAQQAKKEDSNKSQSIILSDSPLSQRKDIIKTKRPMRQRQISGVTEENLVTSEQASVTTNQMNEMSQTSLSIPLISPASSTLDLVASVPVRSNELTFDASKWDELSSDEWRRRIKKIYQMQGTAGVKEIIAFYNKKFPKLTLNINDFISN